MPKDYAARSRAARVKRVMSGMKREALDTGRLHEVIPVLLPREGYDRAAPIYDQWHWTRFWRKNELPLVARWLDELSPGLALDAGSGVGTYSEQLERRGHTCVALDLSMAMLREATCRGRLRPGDQVEADIQSLPFSDSSFDHLLCTRVLSHVDRLEEVASEFARVTRPEGRLVISDVHPEHPYDHVTVSNGFKVRIRVYKHPVQSLLRAFSGCNGFAIDSFNEYRLCDLNWQPPTDEFRKIYEHPELPIFYICALRRI